MEPKISVTWKGIDAGGREVTVCVSSDDVAEHAALRNGVASVVNALKPLPVKAAGGWKAQQEKLKPPANGPQCPNHNVPLTIAEWKPGDGRLLHFWECPTGGRACKDAIKSAIKTYPSPAQVDDWRKINGLPAPASAPASAPAPAPVPAPVVAATPTAFWEEVKRRGIERSDALKIVSQSGGNWTNAYRVLIGR